MIKINLLPQEMAGGRPGTAAAGSSFDAGGTAVVALVLLVIFGINIAAGGYLFYTYNEARSKFETTKIEADAIAEELRTTEIKYRDTKSSIERMERMISVAESLDPPDRLLWARKLNMLPLLVPQGIFLTQIDVTREIREVETQASIARRNEWEKARQGPPPEVEKNPVVTQTMNLRGISYAEGGTQNERLEQIITFYRNLQREPVQLPFDDEPTEFLTGFTPNIATSPVSGTTIEGRDVSQFSFTIRTIPREIK